MLRPHNNHRTTSPSIPEQIAASVDRAASALAMEAACGSISYVELEHRARSLGARLYAAGVGTAAVDAFCLPRSIDQIVALLAAWKAGATYLPLDPHWPDARLAELVERVPKAVTSTAVAA